MKRKLWIMLTLTALLAVLCCGVATAEITGGSCGDDVTWSLDSDTGVLTISGTGAMADFSSFGSDAAPWYNQMSSITALVIGDGVTSIGEYAFNWCNKVTEVTIPDSVTSIGKYAFLWCEGLTEVAIPAGVTEICNGVFQHCTGLAEITIPAGVTSIGNYAFYDCNALTAVTVPAGVTNMGKGPFTGCNSLTGITVEQGNTAYVSVDGVLFSKDRTMLVSYPAAKADTIYTIPDSVTAIGGSLFEDCGNLTTVIIPDSVTSIGDCAFMNCGNLTDLTIPDSVTFIDEYAFCDCSALTSITIPNGVTNIGDVTFYGCSSLTEVTVPASVISIGRDAFNGCTGLTDVTISDGVTTIGVRAFAECTGLTEVTIPASMTEIGWAAFRDCSSLVSVTVYNPDTVIGDDNHDVFKNCAAGLIIHGWSGSTAETYATAAGIDFEPLSDGILVDETNFPDAVFRNYVSLTFDKNSDGLLSLAEIAAVDFIDMENIGDIHTVQGIEVFTELQYLLILGCPSLTSVDLRANTALVHVEVYRTGLTDLSIDGLSGLRLLVCSDNALTSLDVGQFDLSDLYCQNNPMTSLTLGSQPNMNTLWCYGTSLPELDITGCPQLIKLYHGARNTSEPEYDEYGFLFVDKGQKINAGDPEPTFFLPAGLTAIEAEAFSGISAQAVVIPKSVTSISGNPFAGSSVTTIYGYAGSAAKTLATTYSYTFVTIDDEWMAEQ